MGLFGGSSDKYAKRAERREKERQAEIEKGTADVRRIFSSQFNDDFYNQLRQDYLNFYQPQMQQQLGRQQDNLLFSLARSGLSDSSVRGDRFADLQEQFDTRKIELASRANQTINQKRGDVQNALGTVIGQLQTTADASGAAADASSYSYNIAKPPAYEPLGQVFTDATYGLATQADLERRNMSRFNTGLFGGGKSSSSGEIVGG